MNDHDTLSDTPVECDNLDPAQRAVGRSRMDARGS
jgi:hypothetical protein